MIEERSLESYFHNLAEAGLDRCDTLTEREPLIRQLAAEGLSNPDIARKLFISPRNAESHRANLMRKISLHSQADLVRRLLRRNVLSCRIQFPFHPRVVVGCDRQPNHPAATTPRIEYDPPFKCLARRRNHYAVVFAKCCGARDCPVQFQRFQIEVLKLDQQVISPLVTQAATLESSVDEKIVKQSRTHNLVPFCKNA